MVDSVEADDAHFPLAPWGNAAVLGADALSAADARQDVAGVGGTRTLDDPVRNIDLLVAMKCRRNALFRIFRTLEGTWKAIPT